MSSVYDSVSPEAMRRRKTSKWSNYPEDVIPLWVAEMDFPTAPVIAEALADAVKREQFGYVPQEANRALAEAFAGWALRRYGWVVEPSCVHALPDVLKGVELGIEFYSPASSPIVLPTPAYMPFFEVPRSLRRPCIEVPTLFEGGRRVLDLEGISTAFSKGARSIILCNPYNPLGRSFEKEELLALAEVVESHGARVVSDEIHAPLTYQKTHVPYASVSELAASHSVTVVSASKAWNLPGLKCAELVTTNERDEEIWGSISRLATHGASTLGIHANRVAFNEGGDWLDETLVHLERNRRLLAELLSDLLPDVNYVVPEATYLAWLDFNALGLDEEPAEFFLDNARVAMNPGLAFGENGRGCSRLNFATSGGILEQALAAMAKAVRERSRD